MTWFYKGQTIQIDVLMNTDITGAGTNQIKYQKPSGATGAWNASVIDAEGGWLRYILPAASNDESGIWVVWGYIVQADLSILTGSPLEMEVREEGH